MNVMNLEKIDKIANAVLYEGYMLYPYRASSVKNQQRFNWGALAPKTFSEVNKGSDVFEMQTECILQGDGNTQVDIKVRFLHLVSREIGKLENPLNELPANSEPDFQIVKTLETNGVIYQTWQEAVERDVDLLTFNLNETNVNHQFSFPSKRELEPLRDENDKIVGVFVRSQKEIRGEINVKIAEAQSGLYKLTVLIRNLTEFENAQERSRDDALLHSSVSTHTILSATGGEFVSLLDYPDELKDVVAGCKNIKTYPILVGEEGERNCLLSSPIILYDYPQIANESAGDLFDGLEIDEILTLRIMTLTEEEKREMRGLDEHSRRILERTEMMPEEHLLKMHGALRGLKKAAKGEK